MSIWPPIVMLVLMAVGLAINLAKAGEPRPYNPVLSLLDTLALAGLLWWGGFFEPLLR